MDELWNPLELIDVAINMAAAEACYLFPAGWLLSIAWVLGIVGLTLLAAWMAGFALRRCLLAALIVLTFLMMLGGSIAIAYADDSEVDANLVTALDVSSSINAQETMLQLQGMADAIQAPAVLSAIQRGAHKRIGFIVFLWADGEYPAVVAWRTIGSADDAAAAASEMLAGLQTLLSDPTASARIGTLTNLSGALEHAGELLRSAPFPADRTLVNIVGNGEDNVGEDPTRARDGLVASGATINGVVVGGDPDVIANFRTYVIGGRSAFVLSVNKPEDMASVMVNKFVNEMASAVTLREGWGG